MNINKGLVKLTDEPISKRTMQDFPNLPDALLGGPIASQNLGYERPINDTVYIGQKSKELEEELRSIPQKMENLKKMTNLGTKIYLGGLASTMLALSAAALNYISPIASVPVSFIAGALGVGMAGMIVGHGMDGSSKIHGKWMDYYDNRNELDHLRREEHWQPVKYFYNDPNEMV